MKVHFRVTVGILIALLLPTAGAFAHGGEGGQASGGSGQSAVPTPPSRQLVETWRALLTARDKIAIDIEAGTSDRIQEQAEVVPELAQAMMRESSVLSQSKQARVRSGATQLSKVAEHLYTVAGTGDSKILLGDLKRIDRALRLIRAQYPEDSLPLATQPAAGHH